MPGGSVERDARVNGHLMPIYPLVSAESQVPCPNLGALLFVGAAARQDVKFSAPYRRPFPRRLTWMAQFLRCQQAQCSPISSSPSEGTPSRHVEDCGRPA